MDRIKVQTFSEGLYQATEADHCPLWTTQGCSLKAIPCLYGLTEVRVPKECPLRIGGAATIITLVQRPDATDDAQG